MKNANLVKCIAAVATASALGMPASASASDWFEPSAGIVSYEDFQDRWTGFYIGAHAGYGWLDTDDPIEGKIENTESGLGGGFLGYGYQANWLTFGGEVDFSISGFERDRVPGFASGLNADFLGSARARVGAAFAATFTRQVVCSWAMCGLNRPRLQSFPKPISLGTFTVLAWSTQSTLIGRLA